MVSVRLAVHLCLPLTISSTEEREYFEENISKNADTGNHKGHVFYALVMADDVLKCKSLLFLLEGYLVSAVTISLQRLFHALHCRHLEREPCPFARPWIVYFFLWKLAIGKLMLSCTSEKLCIFSSWSKCNFFNQKTEYKVSYLFS